MALCDPRRGWTEPARVTLRREVCTAAAGAATEQEFFTRLRQAGVLVHERRSKSRPDQSPGSGHRVCSRTARPYRARLRVVWYGGGKLAADLKLPKLRVRWVGLGAEGALFGGPGVPAAVVRGALRTLVSQAADLATGEAAFFAALRQAGVTVRLRFSETDPEQVTRYAVALRGTPGRTEHLCGTGAGGWPPG